MGIKALLKCDRCGKTAELDRDAHGGEMGFNIDGKYVFLRISVVVNIDHYTMDRGVRHTALWCRQCCINAKLITDRDLLREEKQPQQPPTIEDIIHDIVCDVMAANAG